jgi:hypothetical protein
VFMRSLGLSLAVVVAFSSLSGQSGSIVVGKNVLVSGARSSDPHEEVWINADPSNPQHLIACSMARDDSAGIIAYSAVYLSTDGGATWKNTLTVKKGFVTGDPVCTFGPDNRAYLSVLHHSLDSAVTDHDNYLYLYTSTDGGRTWSTPIAARGYTDREGLIVDHTRGQYRGRIYLNYTTADQGLDDGRMSAPNSRVGLHVSRSTDGGKSFLPSTSHTSLKATEKHVPISGNSIVLSDGTYMFVYNDRFSLEANQERRPKAPNAEIKVIRSTDGGEHFLAARTVSSYYSDYAPHMTTMIPWMAADPGSSGFRDRVYVVFPDVRTGRQRILLSYSADKGETWSTPVVVSDERAWDNPPTGPNSFQPMVAVNPAGVVGVSWYDRRNHKEDLGYDVRFAASFDGGDTFGPSVQISEHPNVPYSTKRVALPGYVMGGGDQAWDSLRTNEATVTVSSGSLLTGGDTPGLTASRDGTFHPLWVDTRTGIPQLYTATVTVTGSGILHGGYGLETMEDVTKQLALQIRNVVYDQSTQTLTFDMFVKNSSSTGVKGPLKLRVLNPASLLGDPRFPESENGQVTNGVLLSLRLSSTLLSPDAESPRTRVTVRLEGAPPLNPPPADGWRRFIEFTAKIYAPPSK